LHYPDAASSLDYEAHAYAALQDLQGQVIPKLYSFYEVWGILQFLALEPVSKAIPEHQGEAVIFPMSKLLDIC